MRFKKISVTVLILGLIATLFLYPMDSYISQPGSAYDLSPLVEVEGIENNSEGDFNLMTISLSKSTPMTYALSRFSNERKVLPAKNVRRDGESEEEYRLRQRRLMENSKYSAIKVAFQHANIQVDERLNGIIVMKVLHNGASSNLLKIGDIIHKIDDIPLSFSGEFAERIAEKKLGDEVKLSVERDEEMIDLTIQLKEIPGSPERVGLGIQFEEDRTITTTPNVEIKTSNIGGPSAGFMFTLEILNRLIEEDLTKGYHIAGTGEILEDGSIGRIGGVDFKVIAADKDDVQIFFVPDDVITDAMKERYPTIRSNYEEAVETANRIKTSMEIVPVRTIEDALHYLNNLQENNE